MKRLPRIRRWIFWSRAAAPLHCPSVDFAHFPWARARKRTGEPRRRHLLCWVDCRCPAAGKEMPIPQRIKKRFNPARRQHVDASVALPTAYTHEETNLWMAAGVYVCAF